MRTSRPDRNYLAIAQGQASIDGENVSELAIPASILPTIPKDFASALKTTGGGTARLDLRFEAISQCAEALWDANNEAHDCTVTAEAWGEYGQTGEHLLKFKGGVHGMTPVGVCTSSWTKRGAITLGEWSDQSRAKVYGINLSRFRHAQIASLPVIYARAARPTKAELGPHHIDELGSLVAKAEWWGKWSLVTSGLWGLYLKLAKRAY